MIFQQLLAQVVGDCTAAHDEGIAHRLHLHMDVEEELMSLLLSSKESDLIAVLQHEVTVGDDDAAIPLHGTDQDIALEPGGYLMDRHAVQPLRLGQRKLDEPHSAACEGIDLAGTREPQQVGDLLGRCHFGVDDGRDADLLLDEIQLMAVGRVTHTGNGVAVSCLFGEHTAQQVQLIRTGDCDEDICIFHSCLGQGGDRRAIAEDTHDVVGFTYMFYPGLVGVDHRYIMALFTELPRQRRADFAAAHQNDFHTIILSFVLASLRTLYSLIIPHLGQNIYRIRAYPSNRRVSSGCWCFFQFSSSLSGR